MTEQEKIEYNLREQAKEQLIEEQRQANALDYSTALANAEAARQAYLNRPAEIKESEQALALLKNTDWIIAKICEEIIFDNRAEVEKLKKKYAAELAARRAGREKVIDKNKV